MFCFVWLLLDVFLLGVFLFEVFLFEVVFLLKVWRNVP